MHKSVLIVSDCHLISNSWLAMDRILTRSGHLVPSNMKTGHIDGSSSWQRALTDTSQYTLSYCKDIELI